MTDRLTDYAIPARDRIPGVAVGAVSSFLVGELAESLGFDGTSFGDQLLRSAAGGLTSTALCSRLASCHDRDVVIGYAANDNAPATEVSHAA